MAREAWTRFSRRRVLNAKWLRGLSLQVLAVAVENYEVLICTNRASAPRERANRVSASVMTAKMGALGVDCSTGHANRLSAGMNTSEIALLTTHLLYEFEGERRE